MACSKTFKPLLLILTLVMSMGAFQACEESATECTEELACANQDVLVQTCCTELGEDNWSCNYVTPDGTTFECAPITDEVNAGDYCDRSSRLR